mgnify:CR=1 FL=1
MRVHLSTPLNAPPDWVAAQLQSTAVFRHITAPLVRFKRPGGAPWPVHWSPGDLRVQMWLLGLLPMGLGCVEGVTHDYIRHGTTTLFAAIVPGFMNSSIVIAPPLAWRPSPAKLSNTMVASSEKLPMMKAKVPM